MDKRTGQSQSIARAFVAYLKEQDSYALLPEIVQELQDEVYRNQDISVITAIPFSKEEEASLKRELAKKWGEHPILITVDPAILSGMIVRFQDTIIDLSGRSDLRDLVKHLQ